MKIHGMILCRNEANIDRWFKDFLNQMNCLCDRLVFLDDNSTDNTIDIIERSRLKKEIEIYKNKECLWETNEVVARKDLWNKTIEKCNQSDWILCLDCDELISKEHFDYVKYCFRYLSTYPIANIDGLAFKLFDMWNKTHYRFDKWWTGHLRHWCFAVRYNKDKEYKWKETKLHCGRFPLNSSCKMYPSLIPVKHMGWSNKEIRKIKYERYMKIDGNKQDGLIGQYKSILDENPNLVEF
jgi:glycosyltransferase involved in cell wall biosynthesis